MCVLKHGDFYLMHLTVLLLLQNQYCKFITVQIQAENIDFFRKLITLTYLLRKTYYILQPYYF